MIKRFIQKQLERYVRRYLARHKPTLVVVTGSVGKTSAKTAIATVLSEQFRVRAHPGNHNTHMSVPLTIMGIEYPSDIRSISAWLRVFSAARLRIRESRDVDVIVQELGTDQPGDVEHFGTYLTPDIAVVTAVSAEHMEFFKTMDAVAAEELAVAKYAKFTLVNRDDIDHVYARYAETQSIGTYGMSKPAEYWIELDPASPLDGKMGRFWAPEWDALSINLQLIGVHNVKAAVAAGAVAIKLGMNPAQIANGMAKITPAAGRMQLLSGLKDSFIIDDSYNSSPVAAIAALETLYAIDAPQRIAILGSMNEMGGFSREAHEQVAEACNPTRLEWVVTIGQEAADYLAPRAHARGCQVKTFMSPYEAGGFVNSVLKPGGVVLVKGSQNQVFSEEAVKVLLRDNEDGDKLVRQSAAWMRTKREQFDRTTESDRD